MKKLFSLILVVCLVVMAGCAKKGSIFPPTGTPVITTNQNTQKTYETIAKKVSLLSQFKHHEMEDFFPMIVRATLREPNWLTIRKSSGEVIMILDRTEEEVIAYISEGKNKWYPVLFKPEE